MSVLRKNQINRILKKFKKRKNLKKRDDIHLRFGNVGFFFNKDCRFEFIYLALLKKNLKYLNFLKIKSRRFNKIWFFISKNYPISTKSKNSRMGKGKGSFLRWTSRLPRFSTFLELASLDFLKIKKFKEKLNYKFSYNLRLKIHNYKSYPTWVKKNNSFFYLSRYNLVV